MTRPKLPALLSLNGGYVDTAGFLALQGLFTAHVTGNFVTLGASLSFGTTGALSKLLALPTFCLVVILTTVLCRSNTALGSFGLRRLLGLQTVLLMAGAVLAIRLGPFEDGDSMGALLTGMTLVCGMAVQNAASRIHLANAPPTTLMTGTTTQIMIDIVSLIRPRSHEERDMAKARVQRMSVSVLAFALGCGAAALLFHHVGVWCFVVAPIVTAVACQSGEATNRSAPDAA